ncbi:unnamed protein product, partial [Effrenium voratum]
LEYLNKGFNLMSMNTLAAVFDVMDKGFDVVFTDSDNVFLSDPFAAGVSFGEQIRTGRYDYIYQLNWPGPRPYQPGAEIHEGNTGFYFASLRRKPEPTRTLWQAVLKACSRNPQLDGQPNFWNALRGLRQERKPCFRVCQEQQMCNGTAEAEILDYCEMDPFRHRTGWGKRDKDGPVSYHANFKVGRASKISALKGMGLWRPTERASRGDGQSAPTCLGGGVVRWLSNAEGSVQRTFFSTGHVALADRRRTDSNWTEMKGATRAWARLPRPSPDIFRGGLLATRAAMPAGELHAVGLVQRAEGPQERGGAGQAHRVLPRHQALPAVLGQDSGHAGWQLVLQVLRLRAAALRSFG